MQLRRVQCGRLLWYYTSTLQGASLYTVAGFLHVVVVAESMASGAPRCAAGLYSARQRYGVLARLDADLCTRLNHLALAVFNVVGRRQLAVMRSSITGASTDRRNQVRSQGGVHGTRAQKGTATRAHKNMQRPELTDLAGAREKKAREKLRMRC